MKKIIFSILSFIVLSGFSTAPTPSGGGTKIGVAPSLGYTYIEIKNPDNTKSNYDGIAIQFDVSVPIIHMGESGLDVHGFYKKSFVENLSNDGLLSDKANFGGPGFGFNIYHGHLGLGMNYNLVDASHSASGTYSIDTEYNFKTLTYYLDYAQRQKQFTFGGRFSVEAGDIPKSETNYSKDVDFKAYTAWIYFIYNTEFSLF